MEREWRIGDNGLMLSDPAHATPDDFDILQIIH
jgi:hypothetical protein